MTNPHNGPLISTAASGTMPYKVLTKSPFNEQYNHVVKYKH